VAGHAPQAPDEVVIDKQSANDGHLAVGDTTTVLVSGPPQRVLERPENPRTRAFLARFHRFIGGFLTAARG